MMLLQLTLLATAAFAFTCGIHITDDIQKRGIWNGANLGKVVVMKRDDHSDEEHKDTQKRGIWNGPNFGQVVVMKRDGNKVEGIMNADGFRSPHVDVMKRDGTWNGDNFGKVVVMKKRGTWKGDNAVGGQVFGKDDIPKDFGIQIITPFPSNKTTRDLFDMFETGIHVGNKHVIWKRSLDLDTEPSGIIKRGTWNGDNFGKTVVMKRDDHPHEENKDKRRIASTLKKRGIWNGDNNPGGQVVVMKRDDGHPVEENKDFHKRGIMNGDKGGIQEKRGTWYGNNFGSVNGLTPIPPTNPVTPPQVPSTPKPSSNPTILQIPANGPPDFIVYGNNASGDKMVVFK